MNVDDSDAAIYAPSPCGSDFLGSIHLTLTEAEVDLKPV
jgi:hypothetical protein